MRVIARVIGAANGTATPHDGRYVVEWDPHSRFGTLALTTTEDLSEARRFLDVGQVHREWRTVSRRQPWRPDRKPNRPLTAINVETEPAP